MYIYKYGLHTYTTGIRRMYKHILHIHTQNIYCYKIKCPPVINIRTPNLYNYTADINRKNTLGIHLHARHIYLGIKNLYFTGYPTVPSFYPTPPPTNFYKDFRGLPGISPFGHIFPYHPYIKTLNKINKIYLPYFEIPCDLKHTFFPP